MKILTRILLATLLALPMAITAHARTAVPIVNHDKVTWSRADGKQLDLPAVRSAITQAATSKTWSVENGPGDNTLIAKLLMHNKHTINVTITYSSTAFSVNYLSSINMKYAVEEDSPEVDPLSSKKNLGRHEVIHPNYNKWVQELVSAIQTNLSH